MVNENLRYTGHGSDDCHLHGDNNTDSPQHDLSLPLQWHGTGLLQRPIEASFPKHKNLRNGLHGESVRKLPLISPAAS